MKTTTSILRKCHPLVIALCIIALPDPAKAISVRGGTHLLPLNCAELLPDEGPFIEFFAAVARGGADRQRSLSKRMLRILVLREKLAKANDWSKNQNPVDTLVRKTLCFYREQKEPLNPITYDNPKLISFLKSAIGELEAKVEDAIFLTEFEQEQRRQYEYQIRRNRSAIRKLETEASKDATSSYNRITKNAKRKARNQ